MKKILIVFTDVHFAYSPTILQLFKELKGKFDTYILAPEPMEAFSSQKINDSNIIYFEEDKNVNTENTLYRRVVRKIKRYYSPPSNEDKIKMMLLSSKAKKIISYVQNFEGEVIAVDFFALWCVQHSGKRAHLVSLEIHENDAYRENCDIDTIRSVLIQSEERYNYIFKGIEIPKFIVQNAPPYLDFTPEISSRSKYDLIFCGSAVPWFGIYSCIDFIRDYSEYTLTLKGAIPVSTKKGIDMFYKDLVEDGRLIIDEEYLDNLELTHYISKFRIGFAFYDFYRFDHVRTFNYFTAPSGKVFQYLNSGVPIVGNKLPGFSFIEEEKTGSLISHLSSIAIKKAIDEIELSYSEISKNAKRNSFEYDFKRNIYPFIQYLAQ